MDRPRKFLKYAARFCILPTTILVVAGCGASNPDDGLSNKEIMLNRVDQSADLLWDSVSSKSDTTGLHAKEPQSAEEWRKLEEAAATISSSMDLLLVKDRPLVPKGLEVADSDKPGALNAKAIKAIIAANRPSFETHAMQLKAVAEKMRNAARSHNASTLMELGGELDEACEECHKQFWYPPE
jgi:cytochrome c556